MPQQRKRVWQWTVWTAVLIVALVACRRGKSADDGKTIKIGAILDLTGPTSDVGVAYADGLRDYVTWRNKNGGVKDKRIKLLSADYGYKVDRAEQLYSQYVQDGVVAFQGWGTGDTEALRSKIASDKIPFMSASYSANLVDMKKAPYNFLIGTTYSDQAIIAVRWAIDDWKAKGNAEPPKIALVHHDSPFGKSPIADAKAYADGQGVSLTSIPMPRGTTDFVAELAQVKQFGAHYVVIQNVSSPAAVLLKDATRQAMKDAVTFICLNWCADGLMVKLSGDAAEGLVGAMPFTPPSVPVPGHDEPAKWLKQNGSSLAEKGLHYVQGWWTMAIMVQGIEKVLDDGKPLTGENVRAALETMTTIDTQGVSAPLSFSPTNHKGNKSLRMFRVNQGVWHKISDYISAP